MIGLHGPCDRGIIHAGIATGECAERAKPWVLAVTILGSSMAFIDGSVVNVALPAIQADLGASIASTQWIMNAYMVVLGALILVGGAVGDRLGRRRIFVWGVAAFTAASLLCGLAPSAAVLIAARAAQGLGGALLVPSSLAIISATFSEQERGKAIGLWAGFSALTTAFGPVLGGWLVDAVSWRAIFFINLPIALIALALALTHVPESRGEKTEAPLDWQGGLLAVASLGGLAYALTASSEISWRSPMVIAALVAGLLLLALFLWREARATAPMLPLHLFRAAPFSGANLITFFLYFALGSALFFLPFNLIRFQGYSEAAAGAAFLPFTLVMGALSSWAGGLVERYGAKKPLIIGPLIVAAGFLLLARPGLDESYWTSFFPALLVLGLGLTVSVAPLTTVVMSAVADRYAGAASGINNAIARIAGMFAVALLGAVATGFFGIALERRLDDVKASPELRRVAATAIPTLGKASAPDIDQATRQQLDDLLGQSFLASFRIIMLVAAGLTLAAVPCAQLTIEGRRQPSRVNQPTRDRGHEPAKTRSH